MTVSPEPIGELPGATWLNRYNEPEGFTGHPGEVGDAVGRILGPGSARELDVGHARLVVARLKVGGTRGSPIATRKGLQMSGTPQRPSLSST